MLLSLAALGLGLPLVVSAGCGSTPETVSTAADAGASTAPDPFFFFVRLEPGHGRLALAGLVDGAHRVEIGVEEDGRWFRTRPRLSFCEDFDEASLPGRFEEVSGGERAAVVADPAAPSAPNALSVSGGRVGEDVRFTFGARAGVRSDGEEVRSTHGEQRPTAPRVVTSAVTLPTGRYVSVRWDVYVDGDGLGHVRLRSGSDAVWTTEPLTLEPGTTKLAPRLHVGLALRQGAATRVAFDSVNLGEE